MTMERYLYEFERKGHSVYVKGGGEFQPVVREFLLMMDINRKNQQWDMKLRGVLQMHGRLILRDEESEGEVEWRVRRWR